MILEIKQVNIQTCRFQTLKGITKQHTKFGLFLTKALQHVVFDLTQGLGRYHGVVTVTTLFVKTTRPKKSFESEPRYAVPANRELRNSCRTLQVATGWLDMGYFAMSCKIHFGHVVEKLAID